MSIPSVSVEYRPLRVGWIVTGANPAQIENAIAVTSCLWGGPYNPIIPADDPEGAAQLIHSFKVDLLVPIRDAPGVQSVKELHPHLLSGSLHRDEPVLVSS